MQLTSFYTLYYIYFYLIKVFYERITNGELIIYYNYSNTSFVYIFAFLLSLFYFNELNLVFYFILIYYICNIYIYNRLFVLPTTITFSFYLI